MVTTIRSLILSSFASDLSSDRYLERPCTRPRRRPDTCSEPIVGYIIHICTYQKKLIDFLKFSSFGGGG